MGVRRRATIVLALIGLASVIAGGCRAGTDEELILATTTSTQDSGLLDVLVPMFEEATGIAVKPIAVGSGAAIAMARRGDADVLLVHYPAAEAELVADGVVISRTRVMYNDFIIVGPPADPAGIRGLTDAVAAFAAIAGTEARFYSRGDDSGTRAMELRLWGEAGRNPAGASWYGETGQGMGATLTIAGESEGYTLTDRGTWLAAVDHDVLPLLVEGDPRLFNVYHVVVVNPDAFPDLDLNTDGAERFRAFMVGAEAQAVVATFGADRVGQPLFVPYPEE